MKYEEMTNYEKSRVRGDICVLCYQNFTKLDDVETIKMKYGKAILYFHFHSRCLVGWRYPSQLAGGRGLNAEE